MEKGIRYRIYNYSMKTLFPEIENLKFQKNGSIPTLNGQPKRVFFRRPTAVPELLSSSAYSKEM